MARRKTNNSNFDKINEIDRKAKELGMSYGTYVSLYMNEREDKKDCNNDMSKQK